MSTSNQHAIAVSRKVRNLFSKTVPIINLPTALIRQCFSLLASADDAAGSDVYGFDEWLNDLSSRDSTSALEATEIYLEFIRSAQPYLYDHENNLTQLLTRLFGQAEEQEEADQGAMLHRVVAVQDALLALGVSGVTDWLKAAERA